MSVRDIIETAKPCPTCGSVLYPAYGDNRKHLLLMEDVIEAAGNLGWNERLHIVGGLTEFLVAYRALTAYRAEHALTAGGTSAAEE